MIFKSLKNKLWIKLIINYELNGGFLSIRTKIPHFFKIGFSDLQKDLQTN